METYSHQRFFVSTVVLIMCLMIIGSAQAQWKPTPNDTLTSYRVIHDRQIRFSIYAPNATAVTLGGSDIPEVGQGVSMTKKENGVWHCTVGPVVPGAYRYNFEVDGLRVLDPKNPATSESNLNAWSLLYVPGSGFMDTRNVPHGAVSERTYYSKSLERFRRMHVYAPPGYESGKGRYPVFYLLHGAYDTDDAWTSVGRTGFILDNLIADGKAVPMVVVMPAGHTGSFRSGDTFPVVDEFVLEFNNDVVPYIETHYRIYRDREHRAIAGLSMGGAQTLNIAIPGLETYGYIGVYSSGIFGITGDSRFGGTEGPSWEERNREALKNDTAKNDLKLLWFATGTEDFLLETSRATVKLLEAYGFNVTYKETAGGHTWINWREYLHEFVPLLFINKK